MVKMIKVISVIVSFFIHQSASELLSCPNISVSWWENEPFVYTKDKSIMGTIPSYFKTSAKICCKNNVQLDWSDKLGTYAAGLAAVKDPPKSNASKSNTTFHVWVPFSLIQLGESSQKVQREVIKTNQLIVFTYETTGTKLLILYEGFKRIFSFIMITLLITILFGFFIWIAETRSNEKQFPKPFYKGAYHGFWWAIVTVTTVGYGDKSPKTNIGKFIGIVWMSLGMVLFPVLTAEMSSILTGSTYSVILKRVGALEDSMVLKEASDAGAHVRTCKSYQHCQDMLKNGELDAMIVNAHVARPLQAKNPSLLIRTTIPKRVSINVVHYKWHENALKPLINCMQKNSGLITQKVLEDQQNLELKISKEALFTSDGRSVAIYTTVVVIAIYVILFISDYVLRKSKKNRKIGDFREGVFMGNIHPKENKNENYEAEAKDTNELKEEISQLICMQRKSMLEMQTVLEQIEAKVRVLERKVNED